MRENHGSNGSAKQLSEIVPESTLRSHNCYGDIRHIHSDQLRRDVYERNADPYQTSPYNRYKLSHRITLRERRVVLALGQVKRSCMRTKRRFAN